MEIQSVLLENPRVELVASLVYFNELILNWPLTQKVNLICVEFIKYMENLLKMEIQSVLLENPLVELVAGRFYFNELIT